MRKSAITVRGAEMGLTFLLWHQQVYTRTGRFRCWNFTFACVNSFGKSGRRTGAETSSCRTSAQEPCLLWPKRSYKNYSGLRLVYLVQDRRNQNCWRKCVSMKIVPVHGKCVYRKGLIVQNWEYIKWKFVIEMCRKQIQIGIVDHLENWVRYRLIQCPLCFDYFVDSL